MARTPRSQAIVDFNRILNDAGLHAVESGLMLHVHLVFAVPAHQKGPLIVCDNLIASRLVHSAWTEHDVHARLRRVIPPHVYDSIFVRLMQALAPVDSGQPRPSSQCVDQFEL